ncbi:hypothetical protein, variant [Sphaeroforma arctica JP610]|uniref:Peptidase S1 domain-containing protein n=1 Tax=Sphaeroforma arctica JP610 TaxID=667725 RepID=A0A0L0G7U6_9EUKA|nr:hypothetical protein, variant [Sphaeroforma arctica JP610]KNC85087.1 hypothetical protein, variant [Sphaeroforma arctica JP610]|eukprot:XP_014158990.1 hypothetical protein, variant [Sphaeroforma arctica JP610]
MISTILTCAAVVAFAPHCLAQPHSGTVGSNAHSSADVRRDEDFTYPQARIMNGDSQVEVIPYMAALRNVQRFNNGRIQIKTYCGASLIHKDWILTAGHCVETDGVSNTHGNEAWIGCLDLTESDTCVVREIVEYKCHEEFMFDTIEGVHNDICVMKLNESVTDLEVATMNDLPANEVAGTNTTVVGFGTLSENLGASSQLQTVDLPLQPTAVCENTFNYNNKVFFLPDEMMCAGYRTGFFDACLGDSGGPQFVQNWTQPQIGIVSWGDGCGRPDKYGVYTRVSHYIDWIQATTGTPIQLASLDGGLSYEEDLPATTPKDTSATESSTPVPSASSEALVTTSPLHSASPSAVVC